MQWQEAQSLQAAVERFEIQYPSTMDSLRLKAMQNNKLQEACIASPAGVNDEGILETKA